MEFYLTKLVTKLIYPLPLSMLMAGFALLLLWRTRKRAAGIVLAFSLMLLWGASTPVVSVALGRTIERRHLPVLPADLPEAAAIVVLGGGLRMPVPPELWSDLGSGGDRFLHAARLYHAGKAPVVVASGGSMPWSRTQGVPANGIADLLAEWGVPRSALLMETGSRNTYENAVRTKALLDSKQIDDVLLVTSALHMPRALAVFRSAGVVAHPAATDYVTLHGPSDTLLKWIPGSNSLKLTDAVIKEYLGLAAYRWRGWISD